MISLNLPLSRVSGSLGPEIGLLKYLQLLISSNAPAANINRGLGKQAASLPPGHNSEMFQGVNPPGRLLASQSTMLGAGIHHKGTDVDLMSSQPVPEVGKVLVSSAMSPSKNIQNNSTASPKQPS